jgi:hypothetical protein
MCHVKSCRHIFYSGFQKNVPLSQRFFLQPLIPQFNVSELYYGKRYKNSLSNNYCKLNRGDERERMRVIFIRVFCS